MEFRASAEDIARMSHAHPTYAEAMKEAALAATEDRALHVLDSLFLKYFVNFSRMASSSNCQCFRYGCALPFWEEQIPLVDGFPIWT